MSETLGRWHFWLFTIGFHITFDTMHFLGLIGMLPRSIYTYQPDRGWNFLNLVVSVGGLIQGIAVLIFACNFIVSYRRGEVAGDDPWDAWTLEWTTHRHLLLSTTLKKSPRHTAAALCGI